MSAETSQAPTAASAEAGNTPTLTIQEGWLLIPRKPTPEIMESLLLAIRVWLNEEGEDEDLYAAKVRAAEKSHRPGELARPTQTLQEICDEQALAVRKLTETVQALRCHAEDALDRHDEAYKRHQSTESERNRIVEDIGQAQLATA